MVSDDLFRVAGKAANEVFASGGLTYWAYKKGIVPPKALEAMQTDINWYLEVAQRYIDTYTDANMTQALSYFTLLNSYWNLMQKAGTVDDEIKLREAFTTLEFKDPLQYRKMLPSHRYNAYAPVAVFFESTKGADNFKILAVATHLDDDMKTWRIDVAEQYDTIPQIRARRGY